MFNRLLRYCALTLVLCVGWGTTAFGCVGRTGFYPHPTSCSQFVVCVDGERFVMSCPAGLHYSSTLKLCDWPSKISCTLPPDQPSTPNDDQCNMLCPPHVTFYQFPDWTDCRRHYICMKGKITGPHKCPEGLFYNFVNWTCAYEKDVICFNP